TQRWVLRVHLCPVEADQGAVPLRQQEPGRIEPWFGHPGPQILLRPPTLLRVIGEGAGVEREPGAVVPARLERAETYPGGQGGCRHGIGQWATQLEQHPCPGEPQASGERRRRGVIAVGPSPHVATGHGDDLLRQCPPSTLAPRV